jgi:L-2-hydroxyglutarate oxidase LhgO
MPLTVAMESDLVVLGGGVVGLAIAAQSGSPQTILLESHSRFGQETSSRNSEVIHSGINYPKDSLKTDLCLKGRKLLYAFAEKYSVGFRKTGKVVLGSTEAPWGLEDLYRHSMELGVPVQHLEGETLKELTGHPLGGDALFFPETGILDSHELMGVLERLALDRGVVFGYSHTLVGVEKENGDWILIAESPERTLRIRTPRVVNAMGLAAAKWSSMALGTTKWEHRFCQGRYFVVAAKYRGSFSQLVYPLPERDGLGIHLTLDLDGNLRLGPDVEWLPEDASAVCYAVEWDSLLSRFLASGRRFMPKLLPEDLNPGTVGVRPKLFIDSVAHRDFLVEAYDGWVHCLGIESPGLTASLALAEKTAELLDFS